MNSARRSSRFTNILYSIIIFVCFTVFPGYSGFVGHVRAADTPIPLLEKGRPVDWWFVYKFNSQFSPCGANGTLNQTATKAGGSADRDGV